MFVENLQHHPHHHQHQPQHQPQPHHLLAVLKNVVMKVGKATTIVMMKTTIVDVHGMVEIVVAMM